MYKRLYNVLDIHKIFYTLQFGFRASHSVDNKLISMIESIKNSLDSKRYECDTLLDLQKAFDTVHHQMLLAKFEHYGICGTALAWFSSYRSNRSQYVSANGYCSRLLNVS